MNKWRQKLHLEPPQGWMNDPNGLCWFDGRYHVYFQYCPDSAEGNNGKCWGHYQSKDLTSWEFTGTVLFPDNSADRDGVYSGCAFVNGDRLEIFYTGNVKEKGNFDYNTAGRGANVIHVFTEDGTSMSTKEILLRNIDYPQNCSCHVRDPKVFLQDDHYCMVLGARTLDDRGEVLFYRSDDLKNWKYEKSVTAPDFGYMWECPDLFGVNEYRYMSISPQGLPHGEYSNQNIYSSGYFRYDDNKLSCFEEWDYGFDFYAPQTFEAPDGRRIIIGWMGIGDIPYTNPTTGLGWQHCLTLPRELTVSADGGLIQQPVRELESLRYDKTIISDGGSFELSLPFELSAECPANFSVLMGGCNALFSEGVFTLKFNDDSGYGRTERKVKLDKCENIRIIADMSSCEIYLNGGRKVLSTRFYPEGDNVSVKVRGLSANIYKLREMEVSINGK